MCVNAANASLADFKTVNRTGTTSHLQSRFFKLQAFPPIISLLPGNHQIILIHITSLLPTSLELDIMRQPTPFLRNRPNPFPRTLMSLTVLFNPLLNLPFVKPPVSVTLVESISRC